MHETFLQLSTNLFLKITLVLEIVRHSVTLPALYWSAIQTAAFVLSVMCASVLDMTIFPQNSEQYKILFAVFCMFFFAWFVWKRRSYVVLFCESIVILVLALVYVSVLKISSISQTFFNGHRRHSPTILFFFRVVHVGEAYILIFEVLNRNIVRCIQRHINDHISEIRNVWDMRQVENNLKLLPATGWLQFFVTSEFNDKFVSRFLSRFVSTKLACSVSNFILFLRQCEE